MILKSLAAMTKGRLREFKREPSAMFFVLFLPLLWMVVLGLAFSNKAENHFALGLIKPTNRAVAAGDIFPHVEESLRKASVHRLTVGSMAEISEGITQGKILLAIEVSPDGDKLFYYFDQHSDKARHARSAINDLLQTSLGRHEAAQTRDFPLTIPGQRYIDFLIPGLLALSLLTTSLYGTGMTIVSQRKENLLKRFRVTPMNTYSYFLSYLIGRFLVMALETVVIMSAGWLLFDFKLSGSWLHYLLVCLCMTASFTTLSILLGSRMNNTSAYNGMTNLIVFPQMILGGIWFSRFNFPSWLGSIAEYLPLTLGVDALRKIALEGLGFSVVYREVLCLLAYTAIFSVAAKKIFKWY